MREANACAVLHCGQLADRSVPLTAEVNALELRATVWLCGPHVQRLIEGDRGERRR
jgi:hypothetical protein